MPSNYLKPQEYLPWAPKSQGSVRINHNSTECHGESKSLKITRNPDGSVSAKCFRCHSWGKHGAKVDRDSLKFRYDSLKSGRAAIKAARMPSDSESDPNKWPVLARHWIRSYGITNIEIKDWGICWSDFYNRIVCPVVNTGLRGFLSRRIMPTDTGPKWVVHQPRGESPLYFKARRPGQTLVIVEDMVSGYKIARHSSVLAICGVHMTPEMLSWIVSNKFNRFVVWLDNDNHKVRVEQVRIRDRLAMFGDVEIVKTDRDPKEHTDEEIRRVLQC